MAMRISWAEFRELIATIESNGDDTAQLKTFYNENKPGAAPFKIREADTRWTQECQAFLEKLQRVATEQELTFNPKFDLKEWVVARVDWRETCAKDRTTPCPCPDPISQNCPLFYKR